MTTPVDIAELHQGIKAGLTAAFPGVAVDYYPRPGAKIQVPALLIDLDEFEADDSDDIGTEQIACTLRFNVYAVRAYKSGNKLALRTMTAATIAAIHRNRWGQPVGPANVVGAFPDQIGGNASEYEVARIEFTHEALLGASVWVEDGEVPTEVWLGYAPRIGPEYVDDYELVTELPPDES
jgi:hypothetical protein